MHMPDRVLVPEVWATMDVVCVGLVGYAIRRAQKDLKPSAVPLMGVMAAFILAGQMVNFPVAPGVSGHFVGATLAAILLGPWTATLVMTTVLVIQCFLYADGGVYALGVNVFNMALLASLTSAAIHTILTRGQRSLSFHSRAAFTAAWGSVMFGAASVSIQLALSGYSPVAVIPAAMGWHALIGVGEGLITVGALQLIWRTRPDLRPLAREVAA